MSGATVRCKFVPAPKPAPGRSVPKAVRAPKSTGPSRTARMLALAHYIERQIEDGAIPNYSVAARALGLTRARITQVMNLLVLAPDIQGRLAIGKLVLTERVLRRVVGEPDWDEQLALIHRIIEKTGANPRT